MFAKTVNCRLNLFMLFVFIYQYFSFYIHSELFFMMWRDIIQLYTNNNLWWLGIYSRVLYLTYHGRLNVITNSLTCLSSGSWLYFASPLIWAGLETCL